MILITIKIITTELVVIFNIQEKMAITKINYKNNILFPYVMDKWKHLIKNKMSMILLGRYFWATSNQIWVDPVNPLPSKMFIRMPTIHILPISNIILARCNNKIIKYAVKISNVVLMFYFQLKRVSAKLRILYPWSIIFIENTTYHYNLQ